MDAKTAEILRRYADGYENASFLDGDPSWFMHHVEGAANREATAFVASSLSFGSRPQFLPKIGWIVDRASGDVDGWIRSGAFRRTFRPNDTRCFYRFFTFASMNAFLGAYKGVMDEYGTLGGFVRAHCHGSGSDAVAAICRRFREHGSGGVIPQDDRSACKRVCMFLRWMVRTDSPVDLGLWSDFIDRRTLVVPLDTHVMEEARRLGLVKSASASMAAARALTAALAEAFPDDPLRGDFALFGHGVDRH